MVKSVNDLDHDQGLLTTDSVTFAGLTVTSTGNFTGATISNLGTVTTADINGGTIDGSSIGATTPANGTFSNLTAGTSVNFSGATVSDLGVITTADLNGGTIDGTSIGATTAGDGIFNNLTANTSLTSATLDRSGPGSIAIGATNASSILLGNIGSPVSIVDISVATGGSTGALQCAGGASISGNIYTGGNIGLTPSGGSLVPSVGGIIFTAGDNASETLTLRSTSDVTKGSIIIDESTAATSKITGALRVSGGVGVGGSIFCNSITPGDIDLTSGGAWGSQNISMTGGTVSCFSVQLTASGLLTADSGNTILTAGTANNSRLKLRSTTAGTKGYILLDEITDSSSTSSGCMVISGGVGIAKKVFTGDTIQTTNLNLTVPVAGWFYVNSTYTTAANLLSSPATLAIPYVEGLDTSAFWTPNSGSNGILKYTNGFTRYFLVNCAFSVMTASGGAPTTIHLYIQKGGVTVTGGVVERYLSGTSDTGSLCVQACVSLANNDTLSILIDSSSDTPTYSILHGSVVCLPVM